MQRDEHNDTLAGEDQEELERRVEKLDKINAVLMDRVERSMDQQGNAFSLFQTAIGLDAKVRSRTEELTAVLRRLECSNEALVEAKDDAERANLSKTRFLAAASHDLLQPLNAARLTISVLTDLQENDDTRQLAGRVDQSLQTIEDLIKTLLDISKLDAGVVTPEIQSFPLDDVLDMLEASFAPQAEAKGLRLKVRRSGLLVRSDPLLLQRVLQNLVSNAVRYTAQGGILIGVRRRGDRCQIDVVDTGCGLSEAERETMFEEFYRGAAAAKSDHAGLGLGLSIVQRTVQALAHDLDVQSQLGKGSTFRLTLPSPGGATCRIPLRQAERPSMEVTRGAAVVVIENDRDVLDATVSLLRNWSCTTLAGSSLKDIASALADLGRAPDIALVDYHLDDGRTGVDVVRALRDRFGPTFPVVVVTGDWSPAVAADVAGAQCELLRKPTRPAELRALMTHLLGTHSGGED
ncbi:MAG: ATP-binding protein [Methyloceanibacter sp.]|nr:ATP-binding protein [Methyloceanibacter sp.]